MPHPHSTTTPWVGLAGSEGLNTRFKECESLDIIQHLLGSNSWISVILLLPHPVPYKATRAPLVLEPRPSTRYSSDETNKHLQLLEAEDIQQLVTAGLLACSSDSRTVRNGGRRMISVTCVVRGVA